MSKSYELFWSALGSAQGAAAAIVASVTSSPAAAQSAAEATDVPLIPHQDLSCEDNEHVSPFPVSHKQNVAPSSSGFTDEWKMVADSQDPNPTDALFEEVQLFSKTAVDAHQESQDSAPADHSQGWLWHTATPVVPQDYEAIETDWSLFGIPSRGFDNSEKLDLALPAQLSPFAISSSDSVQPLPDPSEDAIPIPVSESQALARKAIDDHMKFLKWALGECVILRAAVKTALGDPLQPPLYKPAGASSVHDREHTTKEKAKAVITKISENFDGIFDQIAQLAPLVLPQNDIGNNHIAISSEESMWDSSLRWVKVASIALLGFGFVITTGGATIGIVATTLGSWSLTITNITSGAIGYAYAGAESIPMLFAIATGGMTVGGLAGSKLNESIKASGGVNKLINNLKASQLKLKTALIQQKVEAEKVESYRLETYISKIQEKMCLDNPESVMKLLKKYAEEYGEKDGATIASIVYRGIINTPMSRQLSLDEIANQLFEVDSLFGNGDDNKKLNFICNVAVQFMTQNGAKEEFNETEYVNWKEIVSASGLDPITFDFEVSRRCGLENKVLAPTLAMKKFARQLNQNHGQEDETFLREMVRADAMSICYNEQNVDALLEHCATVYRKMFNDAEAQKYTVILVCTTLDPYANGIGANQPNRDNITQISYPDAHTDLSTIVGHLHPGDKQKQNDLARSVAEYIWKQSYHSENLEGFATNPIAIECAKVVGAPGPLGLISRAVTIDFAKVDEEVHAADGDNPLSAYHYLYSLRANVCINTLRDLKNALEANAQLSNEDIRSRFEKPLFNVLECWARSESGSIGSDYPTLNGKYGVYKAYQTMRAAGSTDEAKRAFVEYCAKLTFADGEKWTHNQATKIPAIALWNIMNGAKREEILTSINQDSDLYLAACKGQVAWDIKREHILLSLNGKKVIVNDITPLTQVAFRELSPAQIDFACLVCDQGKALGALGEVALPALRSKAKGNLQDLSSDRMLCIIKDGESVYVVLTGIYKRGFTTEGEPIEAYDPHNSNHGGLIKASVIYDITTLEREGFRHGFGSQIPMRLTIECSEADMRDLQIPPSLISETTELDKRLESEALGNREILVAYKARKNLDSSAHEEVLQCASELESSANPDDQQVDLLVQSLHYYEQKWSSDDSSEAKAQDSRYFVPVVRQLLEVEEGAVRTLKSSSASSISDVFGLELSSSNVDPQSSSVDLLADDAKEP